MLMFAQLSEHTISVAGSLAKCVCAVISFARHECGEHTFRAYDRLRCALQLGHCIQVHPINVFVLDSTKVYCDGDSTE